MLYFGGNDEKAPDYWLARQIRRLPIPSWESLATIGRHRSLRLLLWWVVLVPVMARALSDMPDTVHVPWPMFTHEEHTTSVDSAVKLAKKEVRLPIRLDLPFSWRLLYFSGVAVAFGNLLFAWRCPKVVATDPMSLKDLSELEVGDYLADVLKSPRVWTSSQGYFANVNVASQLWTFFYEGEERIYSEPSQEDLAIEIAAAERLGILARDEARRSRLITYAKLLGQWSGFYFRICTAFCYAVAFGGLLWIAWQNAQYVVKSKPHAGNTPSDAAVSSESSNG